MKTLKLLIPLIVIILCFTTCKRYPEGGWSNVAIKHLFGGKYSSSKIWKLKLFEVNGIDSTAIISRGNGFTHFENEQIDFQNRSSGRELKLYLKTKVYEYVFDFTNNKKTSFTIFTNLGADSTQCSSSECERNIFNPEKTKFTVFEWKILRLKKNELIITSIKKNTYKIILIN